MVPSMRVAFCLLVVVTTACAQSLHPPVLLKAGQEPIDVQIGHAAPYLFDWDGDGRQDLLVGQFGAGKLRIYLDRAEQGEPRYEGFNYFQAGGADATVPSG